MLESRVFRPAWLVGLLLFIGGAVAQTPTTPIAARTGERAASGAAPAAAVAQQQRPNVVFVLVDDMGYAEPSCYGNTQVQTPNIDRLAAEGVRFTRFYVNSPICSPSRVALTTGQHPARWRITSYIDSRALNEKRGMAQWLPTDAPVLARMLKHAGYRTGHFGKWHLGGGRDVGEAPLITDYGFDASFTQFEGLGERVMPTFDTRYPDQPDRAMPLAVASGKLGRGRTERVKRYEVTQRYVDRALDFIKAARDAGEPFYVNVWPDDVHTPLEPSPANRGDGSTMAMYRGVVRELDRDLGVLFDAIRGDEKLRSNTLIVFASDNGHDPAITPASSLRGHKANLYEGGIREPLIAWWPGGQPAPVAGTTNESSVIAGYDLVPSILALSGAPRPDGVTFDGEDMSPALRGERPARTSPIFYVRPPDRPGPDGSFPDLAVRCGNWKLLIEEDGSNVQLYNVTDDPTEQTNLAGRHADVVAELKTKLFEWRKSLPSAK